MDTFLKENYNISDILSFVLLEEPMKTTYTYDHYYKYDELTAVLKEFAAKYPDYCKLESNVTTPTGKEQWLMSVTKLSTGDFADKPAWGVNANIHAGEVTGTMCTVYFLDYLMTNKDEKEVDWLLSNFTVYLVPRIAVDGAEFYLTTPEVLRSVDRFYPFEQPMPGLTPADVDGDGVIRQMRVKDPNGGFKLSPEDPRVMIKRLPDDIEGPFYNVYSEGTITEYDPLEEIKDAPSKFGNDFNRNFPMNWLPENKQRGAGSYALSNPETKAMADYMYSHKNLCALLNFHTCGGQYLYPPGFKHSKDADRADIARFKALGKMATEESGYPALNLIDDYVGAAAGSMGIVGAFDDFVSYALGIVDFTCECWDLEERSGHHMTWPRPMNVPEEERIKTFIDVLKWNDENNNGDGYMPWTPFTHPQLGEVEIGGLDYKHVMQNPPSAFLLQEVQKHTRFMLRAMKTLPRLAFDKIKTEKVSENTYKVEAVLMNLGYLPTCAMNEAKTLGVARPVKVTLEGAEIVSGKKEQEVGHLEGFSGVATGYGAAGAQTFNHAPTSRHLTYVVTAPAGTTITLQASAPRAGKACCEILLG